MTESHLSSEALCEGELSPLLKITMKKIYWYIIGGVIIFLVIIFVLRGSEDSWIRDSRGVWIKHGHPKDTPQKVQEQQSLIETAKSLFASAQMNGQNLSNGPCLGAAEDYAVDITHNPRQPVDDEEKNQCQDYINGKLKNFIELDQNGEVFRIK